MPMAFSVLVVALLSYFLGCFNGAVLISTFIIKDDIRGHGSGNAGLTNFYRTYGARYALPVILLDMGKTAASTLIGGYLFLCLYEDWTLGVLVAGLGCIIGHVFPAFYISLGSISAASSVAVSALFLYDRPVYIILAVVTAALVVWSHRSNIVRLVKGNESKFKWHVDSQQ